VQVLIRPVMGGQDSRIGIVAVLNDLTSQYLAEQRDRMMAAALASLDNAVIITDVAPEGESPKIVYVNDGFTKMTGWGKDEAIGKSIDMIDGPRTDREFNKLMHNTIHGGETFHGESIHYKKDGQEITTMWQVNPVSTPGGMLANLVFAVRDVTQIRLLEENIRQSQKIEAVGQLAGGIAHDFNNLLSVINSYADLLSIKSEDDSPLLPYIKNIRIAGIRGTELVSNLMTFSRREAAAPTSLNFKEVMEEVRPMLKQVIRESIDLEISLADDLLPVKADVSQIQQILINLSVNARDAMSNGGCITITVNNIEITEENAFGSEPKELGAYVLLSHQDSGTGMDEATKSRIFEPFFTTKDVGKGTGLGLATIYGLMKQLRGYIEVDTKIGEGTRFDLFFPTESEVTSIGSVEVEDIVPDISRGTECILVVEDDENFNDCVAGLLNLHGYVVYTALSGSEAVEKYGGMANEIKLLISDMVLPKISGRELASRFLDINPDMKVIFMTGYDDDQDTFYSLPPDAEIFQKPFSLTTILSKVRELLDADKEPS